MVALFIIRLTLASATPACFRRVRCTRAWQAAHVIPETGMRIVSVGRSAVVVAMVEYLASVCCRSARGRGDGVALVLDRAGDAVRRGRARIEGDRGRADTHLLERDAFERLERLRHVGDAIAARHPVDLHRHAFHW